MARTRGDPAVGEMRSYTGFSWPTALSTAVGQTPLQRVNTMLPARRTALSTSCGSVSGSRNSPTGGCARLLGLCVRHGIRAADGPVGADLVLWLVRGAVSGATTKMRCMSRTDGRSLSRFRRFDQDQCGNRSKDPILQSSTVAMRVFPSRLPKDLRNARRI